MGRTHYSPSSPGSTEQFLWKNSPPASAVLRLEAASGEVLARNPSLSKGRQREQMRTHCKDSNPLTFPAGVDLTYQGLNTRFQQKDGSQGTRHAWLRQICNVLNASASMCVLNEKDALAWWREPGRIHQAQDEQSLTLHKCDKSQNQKRMFLYKSNGE